jgi:hypothetical protein
MRFSPESDGIIVDITLRMMNSIQHHAERDVYDIFASSPGFGVPHPWA